MTATRHNIFLGARWASDMTIATGGFFVFHQCAAFVATRDAFPCQHMTLQAVTSHHSRLCFCLWIQIIALLWIAHLRRRSGFGDVSHLFCFPQDVILLTLLIPIWHLNSFKWLLKQEAVFFFSMTCDHFLIMHKLDIAKQVTSLYS